MRAYPAQAKVDINMVYSGFLKDGDGNPVSGTIAETRDIAHRNGLFSIVSKKILPQITVNSNEHQYTCDLKKAIGNDYSCKLQGVQQVEEEAI